MKKMIKASFIIMISIFIMTGCKKEDKKTNNNIPNNNASTNINSNTNEGVIKDQILDVFTFKNTSLIYKNGSSIFSTEITNTSNEIQTVKGLDIIIKINDKEIAKLDGYVGPAILNPGESRPITASTSSDLRNATSIEYNIKK